MYRDNSIGVACHRKKIPYTIHPLIGADIFNMMPNANGAALGTTAMNDFHAFVATINSLENGVFINLGSAVTGPEVFLKALSMARNVSQLHDPSTFTTANFDLDIGSGLWWYASEHGGPPEDSHPEYYNRAGKSVLYRAGLGCEGHKAIDIQGDFRKMIPIFHQTLTQFSAMPEMDADGEQARKSIGKGGDDVSGATHCDDSGLSGAPVDDDHAGTSSGPGEASS
jgi:hypothetical protein